MQAGLMADQNLFPDADPEAIQDLNTGFLGRHLFETLPFEKLTYMRQGSRNQVAVKVDLMGSYPLNDRHYLALKRFGYSHTGGHWGLYQDYEDRWFCHLAEMAEDMGVPITRCEIGDTLVIRLEHRDADQESIETARRVLHTVPAARETADELTPILRGWFKLLDIIRDLAADPDEQLLGFFQDEYRQWKSTWLESGEKGARVYNAVRKLRGPNP